MGVCKATALLMAAGGALAAPAATAAPISMWFYGSAADASDKLALTCADRQAEVIEQDERHVLCRREESGVAARFLFSGRSGTTPVLMIRFTMLKDGPDTRIQAAQWIEVEGAGGQTRRSDLDNAKQEGALRDVLHGVGAHDFPSSSVDGQQIQEMPAKP